MSLRSRGVEGRLQIDGISEQGTGSREGRIEQGGKGWWEGRVGREGLVGGEVRKIKSAAQECNVRHPSFEDVGSIPTLFKNLNSCVAQRSSIESYTTPHVSWNCNKNSLNCQQLTCSMLEPSFHPKSSSWLNDSWRKFGVTIKASRKFLHVNCRQLSNFILVWENFTLQILQNYVTRLKAMLNKIGAMLTAIRLLAYGFSKIWSDFCVWLENMTHAVYFSRYSLSYAVQAHDLMAVYFGSFVFFLPVYPIAFPGRHKSLNAVLSSVFHLPLPHHIFPEYFTQIPIFLLAVLRYTNSTIILAPIVTSAHSSSPVFNPWLKHLLPHLTCHSSLLIIIITQHMLSYISYCLTTSDNTNHKTKSHNQHKKISTPTSNTTPIHHHKPHNLILHLHNSPLSGNKSRKTQEKVEEGRDTEDKEAKEEGRLLKIPERQSVENKFNEFSLSCSFVIGGGHFSWCLLCFQSWVDRSLSQILNPSKIWV
ncbi:hypothetical protein VP01_516g3 [Puccinia sorghi]|uniref:Uncharacterized protein n=1 Tax=Puccinia sorghi TaxID=27349 RepID=A0A0L6UKV3_9BASI|nr:hypothetical protein VP01_516g3 [Puccinia sorghi]